MAELKYFGPVLKWITAVADEPTDTDADPQIKGIYGGCEVTASIAGNDARAIRVEDLAAGALLALSSIDARLDDGDLMLNASTPLRLVANCPVLDLPDGVGLWYTFRFHHVTYNGKKQELPAITVAAPFIAEDHDDVTDGEVTQNLAKSEWLTPANAVDGALLVRQVPDGYHLDGGELVFTAAGVDIGGGVALPSAAWSTIAGKPAVIAEGADLVAARKAIDAGMAQRARYGSRTVVDGNSITIGAGSSSTWNQYRGGWNMELARLSNGRVDIVNNAGVGGTNMDARLANFATKVAPYNPETVILSEGTNDLGGTLSSYLTKIGQYYDLVRGIGAQLILGGIYPKSTDAATIATWNTALVEWAKARGVIVIPFWELADPSNGAWPSAWTTDGIHPLRESGAYVALGALAWQTLSRAFTEPVAPTARFVGEGLLTNFFTDLTATITGLASITGITSTTGTLPAGVYDYRVVARSYYGKSPTYDDDTITLGSTGGVTLTVTGSGTYTRRAVYRRGPGDSAFKYIGQITAAGTQTFTDGGLPALYDWSDGDSSRVPTGLLNGAAQDLRTLAYGPPVQTDPEIRGNFLRLTRQEGSGNARVDYFAVTGLTAGQTVTITCKVRGANTAAATERVLLRFRDTGDTTNIDNVPLLYHRLSTDWGLAFGRFVVPAGSDRVRIGFEGDATSPYMDVAELRVA